LKEWRRWWLWRWRERVEGVMVVMEVEGGLKEWRRLDRVEGVEVVKVVVEVFEMCLRRSGGGWSGV